MGLDVLISGLYIILILFFVIIVRQGQQIEELSGYLHELTLSFDELFGTGIDVADSPVDIDEVGIEFDNRIEEMHKEIVAMKPTDGLEPHITTQNTYKYDTTVKTPELEIAD